MSKVLGVWRYEGEKWIWKFTVPAGATADVTLPGESRSLRNVSGDHVIRR